MRLIEKELNTFTKNKCPLWCKYKSTESINILFLGLSGLFYVKTNGGNGSWPFTNWGSDNYQIFSYGVVKKFFETFCDKLQIGCPGNSEIFNYN